MKTVRGKCTYTPDLASMRPESLKKYHESDLYFTFNTEEDIQPKDVIKINRQARYGFFHCIDVFDTAYKYISKDGTELRLSVPDDQLDDYWEIKQLVEAPSNHIHFSKVDMDVLAQKRAEKRAKKAKK